MSLDLVCVSGANMTEEGSEMQSAPDYSPEALGLSEATPSETYVGEGERVWVGPIWDIVQRDGRFDLYRKGNHIGMVNTLELACRIIVDDTARMRGTIVHDPPQFWIGHRVTFINRDEAFGDDWPPVGTQGTVLRVSPDCDGTPLYWVEWDNGMEGGGWSAESIGPGKGA